MLPSLVKETALTSRTGTLVEECELVNLMVLLNGRSKGEELTLETSLR